MADNINDQSEQRRYARVQRFLPVEYFLNDQKGPIQLYTMDISAGGMRVKNPFPIENPFPFPMSLHLDTKKEIKIIAKVIWQKKISNEDFYEIGLEFIHISDEDKNQLTGFIQEIAC